MVAFFTDLNQNNSGNDAVLSTELTGLALSSVYSVAIGTGISHYQVNGTGAYYGGDVVTNFNTKTGLLGGTGEPVGHATQLLGSTVPGSLANLYVAGPITGAFIAGSSVTSLEATGSVNEILTGTAVDGSTPAKDYRFSFEGAPNTTGDTLLSVPTPKAGTAGPSISNVVVGSAKLIKLGTGGPGTPGGSVNGLIFLNDATGFTVMAGAGGSGGIGRAYGGKGGSITNVLVEGPPASGDSTPNSADILEAGAGGAGVGVAGGGAGGSVQNVYVDFTAFNINNPDNPGALLADNVAVLAGAGGTGGTGGAGGSLDNINVLTATPHDTTTAFLTSANPFEYQLLGGAGGAAVAGGRGGAGGSVANSYVDDRLIPSTDAATGLPNDTAASSSTNAAALIAAGAGGSSKRGSGGVGGVVDVLTLRGYNFQVAGGAGGDGLGYGAAGGTVASVTVLGSTGNLPGDNFHAESVKVTGGDGGDGSTQAGGAGGSIVAVTINNADFDATGLDLTAGSGGAGKVAGGAGGAIGAGTSDINITAVDFLTDLHPYGVTGAATIAAGNGGAATGAGGRGGAGGAMTNVTLISDRLGSVNISAGNGGNGGVSTSAGAGFGGAGGIMTTVSVRTSDPANVTPTAGLLLDTTADFVTDKVVAGDIVINANTGATTKVTGVSATELSLASNIFATGDDYVVDSTTAISGTAQASQDSLVDTTSNFITQGVKVGDVVEDVTTLDANLANAADGSDLPARPYTALVTGVSANVLTLSGDISHVGDQYIVPAVLPTLGAATLTGGSGGSGGQSGYGGAGGGILGSSANAQGTVTLIGGTGGKGGVSAAAGAGGTLNGDGALSTYGSSLLYAGNAGAIIQKAKGASAGRAGAGGSIIGANVQALLDVSLIAGNGSAGGAGGSVNQAGFTGAPATAGGLTLAPPVANITVEAGSGGSSASRAGGAGGSINLLTGFISSGNGVTPVITEFLGGAGGSGETAGGAGGSVNNVRLFGGGGGDVTFFIDAGDAGNAVTGNIGATGGSVTHISAGADASNSGIANFSISPLTDFNHISAGDGGNARLKGGLGGSVSSVLVNSDIGVLTGRPFGFNLAGAGGISAGAGGTATVKKTAGQAGNVTGIAANAIASIVAGHMTAGQGLEAVNLAYKVDAIILNGTASASPTQVVDFTYGGETTVTVPTDATALEVSLALNDLSTIQAAGGVTVAADGIQGYTVTFTKTGARTVITGQEPALDPDGNTAVVTEGVLSLTAPNTDTQQQQTFDVVPLAPFALSFQGQTTALLGAGATADQVANALNSLPAIQAVGGVNVVDGGAVAGYSGITATTVPSFQITFNDFGGQTLVTPVYAPYTKEVKAGTTTTADAQNVQVFGIDPFSLTFLGDTTVRLPAKATAAQVMTALNAVPTIVDAGGVTVTYQAGSTSINPSYTITFKETGGQPAIIPNFDLYVLQSTAGTASLHAIDVLTYPTRGDIAPPEFASANVVGSIEDILRPHSTTFDYTNSPAPFKFGDAPIDGLIAALTLTADKNFVPEAFVTSNSGTAILIDPTTT